MQFAAALSSVTPFHGIVARSLLLSDPMQRARHLLRESLAHPDLLGGLPLARRPGHYERNFLLGDHTMSVWAMVWEPGAMTSIHDHHCACCFAVLSGQLTERWFAAVGPDTAIQTAEAVRRPGFMACMDTTGPNIHQMLNTGVETAISIHVYGFDHELDASSVQTEYSAALRQ